MCSRTIVRETFAGRRDRVASRDPTIMVANAIGTVHAAGCASSTPHQPGAVTPNSVRITAPPASSPPTTRPAPAPRAVSPRHQMPSTSRGQNVEAATAKASSTAFATAIPVEARVSPSVDQHRQRTGQPEGAHAVTLAAQQVLADHAGDRDHQPGGGREERGERPRRRARAVSRSAPAPCRMRPGSSSTTESVRFVATRSGA